MRQIVDIIKNYNSKRLGLRRKIAPPGPPYLSTCDRKGGTCDRRTFLPVTAKVVTPRKEITPPREEETPLRKS